MGIVMCALGLEEDPCKCDEEGDDCLEQKAEEAAAAAALLPAAEPAAPPPDADGDDLDQGSYAMGDEYELKSYPPQSGTIVIPAGWSSMHNRSGKFFSFDLDSKQMDFKSMKVRKIENKYEVLFGTNAEVYYGSLLHTHNNSLIQKMANMTGFFVVRNYTRFKEGRDSGDNERKLTIVVPAMAMDFAHYAASALCCPVYDTHTGGQAKNFVWTEEKLPTNWNSMWKILKDPASTDKAPATYDHIQWTDGAKDADAAETDSDWDKYKKTCTKGIDTNYEKAFKKSCSESYTTWVQKQEGFPLTIGGESGTPYILGTPDGKMTLDLVEKFDENSPIVFEPTAVAADRRNRRVRGHEFSKLRKDETYLNHLLKKR